jgi:tellurite resistance protein TehA-like permease
MSRHPTPLKFLIPGWFVTVMGLSGLALAWHNAGGKNETRPFWPPSHQRC